MEVVYIVLIEGCLKRKSCYWFGNWKV